MAESPEEPRENLVSSKTMWQFSLFPCEHTHHFSFFKISLSIPQIVTAVNFLTNPNVQRSTLNQKQRFLLNKGLSDKEVQIACERAGVFTGGGATISAPRPPPASIEPPRPPPTVISIDHGWKRVLSTFERIKEVLSSVAVFSGAAYLVYKFYKKFIEPWLFGRGDSSRKSLEQKVDSLSVKVETDLRLIREELSQNNQFDLRREIQNFKSDLDAIKGLLLNKKQFASPNLPVVPPSIPSWQLKTRHDSENDKNDDAGSGSGSSETEVVTKNSDSSLEIM